MEQLKQLTYDKVLTAVIVFFILLWAYNTTMAAVKNRREEKRLRDSPVSELKQRVDRHDDLLQKDKDRLDEHEKRLKDVNAQSTIMLRGVRALLSHEINGNSTEKLESSMTEIDDYLIKRGG